MNERELTIVAVGDQASKKTELLVKYTYNKQLYQSCMPNIFNNVVREIIVDYTVYSVQFIDSECDDDYKLSRWDSFKKANVFLLCYSISERNSFNNALTKWCVEIRKIKPNVPIVLVATDAEARSKPNRSWNLVSVQEGEDLKFAINACSFVECSVEKMVGVDDVFIEAVRSTYCNTMEYINVN